MATLRLIWPLFGLPVVLALSGAAYATEGGGSQYGIGAATILPGVQPTPPGFNIVNYNLLYVADRLNNTQGAKAIPKFHVDLMLSFVKLDYSFPEPIAGIR